MKLKNTSRFSTNKERVTSKTVSEKIYKAQQQFLNLCFTKSYENSSKNNNNSEYSDYLSYFEANVNIIISMLTEISGSTYNISLVNTASSISVEFCKLRFSYKLLTIKFK